MRHTILTLPDILSFMNFFVAQTSITRFFFFEIEKLNISTIYRSIISKALMVVGFFFFYKIDKYYWKILSKITMISCIKFKFQCSLSNFTLMLFSTFSWLLDLNFFSDNFVDKYKGRFIEKIKID